MPGPAHFEAWPRVAEVRARLVRVALARAWLKLAVLALLPGACFLLADWWFEFPRTVRAVLLAGWLAALLVGIWKWGIRPLRSLPRGDRLALYIERAAPSLRSRLISFAQLKSQLTSSSLGSDADGPSGSLDSAATAFVLRLQADTARAAGTLDPRTLVPVDSVRRLAWRSLPILVGVVVWFLYALPTSGLLLRRAWLDEVPVPRKTRLLEVTGPLTVGRGDEVTVRARVEGVIPAAGVLEMRHGSGRVQRVPLDRDAAVTGGFARTLPGVATSFRYRLRLHDAESDEFEVRVLPRPVLTNLTLVQVWPAYSGRPELERRPGELSLLLGSRLRLEGQANRPLSNAVLRLGGLDRAVEATLDPSHAQTVRLEIPIDDPRLDSLMIELRDREGIGSRDSAVYAVEVVPDRPPQVRLVQPVRREELATRRGMILVAFEAEDDVGLGGVGLCHQPAGDTNAVPARIELELEPDAGASIRRRVEWRVDSIKPLPAEGAMIEFWIEASDRNDVGGPGVGRSEKYLLRVVSEAEKRADLLARAGDAIGRLGDVAQGQDRLNESLGRIIMLRPSSP